MERREMGGDSGKEEEKLAGRKPGAQSTLREGDDRMLVEGEGVVRPWKQSPAWHGQRRS